MHKKKRQNKITFTINDGNYPSHVEVGSEIDPQPKTADDISSAIVLLKKIAQFINEQIDLINNN